MMHEVIFVVEDAPEGGFIARALEEPKTVSGLTI